MQRDDCVRGGGGEEDCVGECRGQWWMGKWVEGREEGVGEEEPNLPRYHQTVGSRFKGGAN